MKIKKWIPIVSVLLVIAIVFVVCTLYVTYQKNMINTALDKLRSVRKLNPCTQEDLIEYNDEHEVFLWQIEEYKNVRYTVKYFEVTYNNFHEKESIFRKYYPYDYENAEGKKWLDFLSKIDGVEECIEIGSVRSLNDVGNVSESFSSVKIGIADDGVAYPEGMFWWLGCEINFPFIDWCAEGMYSSLDDDKFDSVVFNEFWVSPSSGFKDGKVFLIKNWEELLPEYLKMVEDMKRKLVDEEEYEPIANYYSDIRVQKENSSIASSKNTKSK